MSRGILISLSGLESSGKSTQLELLLENAHRQGLHPIYLWTRPGYTRNLEAAKRLIRRLTSGRGAARSSRSSTSERELRDYLRRGAGFRSARGRRVWLTLALIDLIWVYGLQIRY